MSFYEHHIVFDGSPHWITLKPCYPNHVCWNQSASIFNFSHREDELKRYHFFHGLITCLKTIQFSHQSLLPHHLGSKIQYTPWKIKQLLDTPKWRHVFFSRFDTFFIQLQQFLVYLLLNFGCVIEFIPADSLWSWCWRSRFKPFPKTSKFIPGSRYGTHDASMGQNGIFAYFHHKSQPNVTVNIPYMDPMGMLGCRLTSH